MRLSRRLLDDEFVVVSTRTHVKALVWPALLLIVIAAVAGFLSAFPSGRARPLVQVVIWGLAFFVIIRLVGKPFLAWLTTTYTVTNRRLIGRYGIFTRRGHDIPLAGISDVTYERGILDRLLGSGTLVISDASEYGRVLLRDIPHVEQVHRKISDQMFDSADSRRTYPDTYPDR